MAWRAGAAEIVITPPVGGDMDGYGARKTGSIGVHDDLLAHALVLDDGSRRTAIVTCDVLFVDGPTVAAVRAAAEQRWGIPPERVLVAATHTHQGPKGLTGFRSTADTALIAIITRQIVGAIGAATHRLAPARLMAGAGQVDSVSLNRRFEERPVDTTVRVLRVEGEDGALRAALINYACHPTVLGPDNLMLSQDWPGFACRAVKALWGDVPVLFANGACGDVNPIKIGETFEDARRAGTIVGAAAARILGELAAHGKPQVVHNTRRGESTPKPPAGGVLLEGTLAGAIAPVTLPIKEYPSDEEYRARLGALRDRLDAVPRDGANLARRRELAAAVGALRTESATAPWGRNARKAHPGGYPTEVQYLKLGDGAAIITAPGELATEIGLEMGALSPAPETFVVGYANDGIGYLMPDDVHEEGGYEAGRTLFTRGVKSRLLAAAAAAVGSIV
jgi:neutral ceramidase